MTEDNAKQKWCPMVRDLTAQQSGMTDSPYNRLAGCIEESTKCIASDCMMWREAPEGYNGHNQTEIEQGGYCGLGGKV